MIITLLSISLCGYVWSDFLVTRDLQMGCKSRFNPIMKLVNGIVVVSFIIQIVVHSGIIK